MQTADSLEKTLMLGETEGRRIRGWQRTRWLDGITDSTDMRQWRAGKPGMLQSTGLQSIGYDLVTEQPPEWVKRNVSWLAIWRAREGKPRGREKTERGRLMASPEPLNLSSKLKRAKTVLKTPFFWGLANLIKIYIQIRSKLLSTATNKKHWQIQPLILCPPKETVDRINATEILKPCVDTAVISP